MRFLFMALVMSVVASAQTITFAEQPFSRIQGLREYQVIVSSDTILPRVEGLFIVREAVHQNIRVFLPVSLQQYVDTLNKASFFSKARMVLEIAAYITSSGVVLEKIVVKEVWAKEIIASVGPGLTITRIILDKNDAPVKIPADGLLPGTFQVGPGQTVVFPLWAM